MATSNKEKIVWIVIVSSILLFLAFVIFYLFKSDLDATKNKKLNTAINKAIKKKEHKIYMPKSYNVNFTFKDDSWVSLGLASDKDLIVLAKKNTIKKLTIKHSEITANAFAVLNNQPLVELLLFKPHLKQEELKVISGFRKLRKLSLRNNMAINDDLIVHLTGPKNLKKLVLRNTDVADKGLSHIAQTFPHLKFLDLRKCRKVTYKGIQSLKQLKRLKRINLNNISLSKAALQALAEIKSLETIEIVGCLIDDAKLVSLVKSPVRKLVLSENQITVRSLNTTLRKMKLKRLVLKVCSNIKESEIKKFRKSHPNTRVTWTARVEQENKDSDPLDF